MLMPIAAETENEEAYRWMIEFAATSGDKSLVDKLIDYLIGEHDGIPKASCGAVCVTGTICIKK